MGDVQQQKLGDETLQQHNQSSLNRINQDLCPEKRKYPISDFLDPSELLREKENLFVVVLSL